MIRALQSSDYDQWLPLWQENCLHQMGDDVTAQTWDRICQPGKNVFGLGAFEQNELQGILHYVLHPTTGSIMPACYMQDLFITPPSRRKGRARALVKELEKTGKTQGWARIYWLAEAENEAAQNLYKSLGIKIDFTLHILPTQQG